MIEDTSRTERFFIRFLDLSEQSLADLRVAFPQTELSVHPRDTGLVVVMELAMEVDYEPLYGFLQDSRIATSSYSVWVSVVTSSDHSGVSVPDYVLQLIRRTQGGLDFSFVALGPDDPDVSEVDDLVPHTTPEVSRDAQE